MDQVGQIADFVTAEHKNHITRIVRDAGQRLMRFIRARVSSDADAEDVLQDVWQQLVATLETGPVEQVSAWLYTVARNRIIDRYRKPKLSSLDELTDERVMDDAAFEFPLLLLRDDKTPETELLRHLFWEQLHAALAELPKEQRQVFVWHELDGLSFQEIAALTGGNVNTLLSRKRYAVLHLRSRLEQLREDFFS